MSAATGWPAPPVSKSPSPSLSAELARRIPVEGFLAPGSAPVAVEHSKTLRLDLTPWLLPGDDLERFCFTSVLAVPMVGRSGVDGALLLSGTAPRERQRCQCAADAPRLDDLLPIEMLASRLQATRSQTMLFEKLIDSERFAGLGQLAGNVTQQLNSPLTVILGYASLLNDSPRLEPQDRKAVEAIVQEARRIRSTLESLSRVSLAQADQPAAISVTELLADMEQLYRPEFLLRSIEFEVNVAPGMPRILCGAQQLRQALLHCLQYAIGAVDREGSPAARDLRPSALKPAARAAWSRSPSATPAAAFSSRARLRSLRSRARRRHRRNGPQPVRHHPARPERPRLRRQPPAPRRRHHSRAAGGLTGMSSPISTHRL